MIADPLFYAAAVPAVVLMGLSKGGFSGIGLLSLPLMALVVSPVQAAAVMLPILIVQDVVTVWSFRRAVDRRNLAILLPSSAVGVAAAWLLAARVSDAAVALAVGAGALAGLATRSLAVGARVVVFAIPVAQLVEDGGMRPVDAGPLTRTRELEAAGLLHIGVQGALGTGFASALKVLS
jgi:uncharacterized membrane protein YfcA